MYSSVLSTMYFLYYMYYYYLMQKKLFIQASILHTSDFTQTVVFVPRPGIYWPWTIEEKHC